MQIDSSFAYDSSQLVRSTVFCYVLSGATVAVHYTFTKATPLDAMRSSGRTDIILHVCLRDRSCTCRIVLSIHSTGKKSGNMGWNGVLYVMKT